MQCVAYHIQSCIFLSFSAEFVSHIYPKNCDAHLAESNFQTRSNINSCTGLPNSSVNFPSINPNCL
ncbi:MAG: DUF6783 domain-containing protein [Lacrimispora saccharolytica]